MAKILRTSPKQAVLQSCCSNFGQHPLKQIWKSSNLVKLQKYDEEKQPQNCRSSYQRCSMKKGVLTNLTKFTGKHLCQSLFFIKKRLWHRCFSVNFVKFLRTPFLQNPSGRLLLKLSKFRRDRLKIVDKKIIKYLPLLWYHIIFHWNIG